MKKFLTFVLVCTVTLLLGSNNSFAGKGNGENLGNGLPTGQKYFQFNIIGKKVDKGNSIDAEGWDSNGKSIMIPLGESPSGGLSPQCLAAQNNGGVNEVEAGFEYTTTEPTGAKLHWTICDATQFDCPDFAITDRNALDGNANIDVSSDMLCPDDNYIMFDVWIRVMGKPNQCLTITGWAKDDQIYDTYWFKSGTVYLSKKRGGGTTFQKINDMFDVYWCEFDEFGVCIAAPTEISVFDEVFEDYFWAFDNQGTKVVQVRIYESEDGCPQ